LIQAGTAVLGIVGSFVLPPPVSIAGEPLWRRLAQFVAAVLIALMFVATRRVRSRGRALWWWVALAGLGLAVLGAFGYDHLTRAWSCSYDGSRVIVGDEYTQQGREQRRQDPSAACETLIQNFAGHIEDIWLSDGIRRRQSILAAVYVGAVALFTICIVAVVEAMAQVDRTGRQIKGRGRAR
jgi:hypothetical protein